MTKDQRIKLMGTWWPDACAAQGWDKNDREKRLQVFSHAVGRPLDSANELNTKDDIDRVKSRLLYLADNIDHEEAMVGTTSTASVNGEKRRLLHTIRELSLQFAPDWLKPASFENHPYTRTLMENKFGDSDPSHLTIKELTDLRNTLAARLSAKHRKQRAPQPVESNCPF